MNKDFSSNPQKIKEDQNRRIHKTMKDAYKIPFYQKKFEESGTTPDDYHCSEDLVKFPTMDKAELRQWMEGEYNAHPEMHDKWEILRTSGSSGNPMKVLLTHKEFAYDSANWIRELMVGGYHPLRGKMFSYRTGHSAPNPKGRDSIIQKFGFMRRKVVGEENCVGDGIKDYIDAINEYEPQLIVFRRNCMVRIVMYAKQHDLPLWKPDLYVPVSETVDSVTRNLLEETLGPGLIDAYGCTETGNCIIRYPGDDFFYVVNDMAVANVYDDNDQLADNGRIILTSLYKESFPIINYDVGDGAESYVKDGLRYFTSIQGRLNDLLKHEGGYESSIFLLMKAAYDTVGLAQFKYIQETYHDLLIQLSPDPACENLQKDEIEKHFRDAVERIFKGEFKARIEWLDIIPPDETGKQRCFVCKVK